MQRYHRQIIFPEWGEERQAKLRKAKVVQVGCGGLGSTLAECLVRAGVGKLTIIDRDVAEITNLHRQFLFDEDDVRKKEPKAMLAVKKLRKANSEAKVIGISDELSVSNVELLLSGHNIVLDGTDNMATRYLINDWCVRNHTPWIYGGVNGSVGMTMTILPKKGPCLRCLYPDIKTSPTEIIPILNTLPILIAALQVTEAFKLMLNSSDLIRDLRVIDLWSGDYQQIPISQNPECPCCKKQDFSFLM